MTEAWNEGVAVAVIGFAVTELWKGWQSQAPSLHALSTATRGDDTHQQLMDATYSVGSLVVLMAVASVALTRKFTIATLLAVSFTSLVLWYTAVLNRQFTLAQAKD